MGALDSTGRQVGSYAFRGFRESYVRLKYTPRSLGGRSFSCNESVQRLHGYNTIWRASHKPLMPFLWCPCLRVEKRQPFWHCLEMYFKATYYGHVFWLSFGWHLIWTSMNIQLEQQVPEVPTCCTKVCSTLSRYATPPGGEPLVDGTPDDWNDAR